MKNFENISAREVNFTEIVKNVLYDPHFSSSRLSAEHDSSRLNFNASEDDSKQQYEKSKNNVLIWTMTDDDIVKTISKETNLKPKDILRRFHDPVQRKTIAFDVLHGRKRFNGKEFVNVELPKKLEHPVENSKPSVEKPKEESKPSVEELKPFEDVEDDDNYGNVKITLKLFPGSTEEEDEKKDKDSSEEEEEEDSSEDDDSEDDDDYTKAFRERLMKSQEKKIDFTSLQIFQNRFDDIVRGHESRHKFNKFDPDNEEKAFRGFLKSFDDNISKFYQRLVDAQAQDPNFIDSPKGVEYLNSLNDLISSRLRFLKTILERLIQSIDKSGKPENLERIKKDLTSAEAEGIEQVTSQSIKTKTPLNLKSMSGGSETVSTPSDPPSVLIHSSPSEIWDGISEMIRNRVIKKDVFENLQKTIPLSEETRERIKNLKSIRVLSKTVPKPSVPKPSESTGEHSDKPSESPAEPTEETITDESVKNAIERFKTAHQKNSNSLSDDLTAIVFEVYRQMDLKDENHIEPELDNLYILRKSIEKDHQKYLEFVKKIEDTPDDKKNDVQKKLLDLISKIPAEKRSLLDNKQDLLRKVVKDEINSFFELRAGRMAEKIISADENIQRSFRNITEQFIQSVFPKDSKQSIKGIFKVIQSLTTPFIVEDQNEEKNILSNSGINYRNTVVAQSRELNLSGTSIHRKVLTILCKFIDDFEKRIEIKGIPIEEVFNVINSNCDFDRNLKTSVLTRKILLKGDSEALFRSHVCRKCVLSRCIKRQLAEGHFRIAPSREVG